MYGARVKVEERVSQKGNKYYWMTVIFDNGYKYETFVSNEVAYIVTLNKKVD